MAHSGGNNFDPGGGDSMIDGDGNGKDDKRNDSSSLEKQHGLLTSLGHLSTTMGTADGAGGAGAGGAWGGAKPKGGAQVQARSHGAHGQGRNTPAGAGGAWGGGGGRQNGPPVQTLSYANIMSKDIKFKFINCYLKRAKSSETPFTLTMKEKARLIFVQLRLPREKGMVLGYCEQMTKCFRIVVNEKLQLDKYLPSHEIEIRKGLTIMSMKERKSETMVEVSRLSYETSDEEIVKSLSIFGKVKSIKRKEVVVTDKELEDPDIRLLSQLQIKTNIRNVEMDVFRNIPSFIPISGKKARIFYHGQEWSCKECLHSFKKCPSNGNKDDCKQKKNPKLSLEKLWSKITKESEQRPRMNSSEEFQVKTMRIDGVLEGMTREQIALWMKTEGGVNVLKEQLIFQPSEENEPHFWILDEVPDLMMKAILQALHGATWELLDGQSMKIWFTPVREFTPAKEQRRLEAQNLQGSPSLRTPVQNHSSVPLDPSVPPAHPDLEHQALQQALQQDPTQQVPFQPPLPQRPPRTRTHKPAVPIPGGHDQASASGVANAPAPGVALGSVLAPALGVVNTSAPEVAQNTGQNTAQYASAPGAAQAPAPEVALNMSVDDPSKKLNPLAPEFSQENPTNILFVDTGNLEKERRLSMITPRMDKVRENLNKISPAAADKYNSTLNQDAITNDDDKSPGVMRTVANFFGKLSWRGRSVASDNNIQQVSVASRIAAIENEIDQNEMNIIMKAQNILQSKNLSLTKTGELEFSTLASAPGVAGTSAPEAALAANDEAPEDEGDDLENDQNKGEPEKPDPLDCSDLVSKSKVSDNSLHRSRYESYYSQQDTVLMNDNFSNDIETAKQSRNDSSGRQRYQRSTVASKNDNDSKEEGSKDISRNTSKNVLKNTSKNTSKNATKSKDVSKNSSKSRSKTPKTPKTPANQEKMDKFLKPKTPTPGSKLKLGKNRFSPFITRSPSLKRRLDDDCTCDAENDPDRDFVCKFHDRTRSDDESSVSSSHCDDGYIMVGRDGKPARGTRDPGTKGKKNQEIKGQKKQKRGPPSGPQ